MDSNGDGVGDLAGITSRLDYLQSLGVTAIWISPIYPSPMADFGYDVSDYTGIHPLFGSLDDFDRLIAEAHRREIRVILDYVPNHTSDQHPWFIESRSSTDNPKRDWYIWRHARPGGAVPNNWLSHFGGTAWEWDEQTRQYYYHAFLKEQPDLNWRNPKVQAAMMDVLRFWLDRGVDGFRVDVIWELIKDQQFRDNPVNERYVPGEGRPYLQLLPLHNADQPEVHEVIRQIRSVIDEYQERVLIGEIYLPLDRLMRYYGENGPECHMPYNFSLVLLPWDARRITRSIEKYEHALPEGAWPNWVLGNHDVPRIATRAGSDQARVAAMLLLTLRGTPTMYYGDELGMESVPVPPEVEQDPVGKNIGSGFSRDPSRTPMQWDAGPSAGFTTGTPWLPLSDDSERVNVAALSEDPESLLSLYRRLIALRQSEAALSVGSYEAVPADGDLLAYIREHDGERFVVVLNLGREEAVFSLPEAMDVGEIVVATDTEWEKQTVQGDLKVAGSGGVVIGNLSSATNRIAVQLRA
jgi:alpha-glucosidase